MFLFTNEDTPVSACCIVRITPQEDGRAIATGAWDWFLQIWSLDSDFDWGSERKRICPWDI